jgi:hypothetical protein
MNRRRLAILCGLLLTLPACFGQTSNQGAIVGTVVDPSGALIPQARITATNLDTGVSRTVKTTGAGDYQINFLIPGRYKVVAQAKGFRETVVNDVNITVGQLLRTDVKMKMGIATDQVVVDATAAPLNVDTGSRGEVIGSEAIKNLPLNGREWIQLATLVPGAESGNVKGGTYKSKGVEFSFNGSRDTHNGFFVDGADSTDAGHNTLASSPALDAIKEFRVETNAYSAQYGRAGGAIVLAVTNSGTNAFHGSLYEYHRNKALDAPPPFATGPNHDLPNYLFNQFGGSIGGPVRRNKVFFFFNMEKFRQVTPGSLIVGFAPSAAEATGDVSHTINPYTNEPVVLTNPLTGDVIPSGVLPDSLISPIGKTLMAIWSQYKPNFDDPFVNLRYFRGSHSAQNKYLWRGDYNINEKNLVFGTFDWNDYDTGEVGNTIYGDQDYKEHTKTVSATYTHIFTSNLVNDLKFSRMWDTQGTQFVLNDQSYAVKWGMNPTINAGTGSPRILMYTLGYQTFTIGNSGADFHNQQTLYIRDDLAWVKGRHTVHFGADFRRENYLWTANSGQTQDYFGLLDGLPGYGAIYGETGSVFTDLLTAMPNLMNIGAGDGSLMPFSRNAFSGYVQDDWKVNSRLTLNIGLRYDYEAPFAIDNGKYLGLDFNTGLPRYCASAPAAEIAIMHYNFETGGPCTDHQPDYHDVSPRVGFAFRPNGDDGTVLRGGFGLFYTSENAYTTTYGGWVQPFAGQYNWNPGSYYWQTVLNPTNPLFDGQQHFTTMDQIPYGLTYDQGESMGYFFPSVPYFPTAYVEQYNLTAGKQAPGRIALELGYVGSHGINLTGPVSVYNYDPTLLTKIQTANPQLSNFGLRMKGFRSFYNSLQASARKEVSHGLYFLAAYTWAHALTDMSDDDTNETLFTDSTAAGAIITKRIANADFDYRHRFSFSGTWALPVGRGQQFGSNWNPVVNGVLGGWQANAIVLFQGGFPFTVYDSSLKFPDRVCDGQLPHNQRNAGRWFDTTCFVTHIPTTIINPITHSPELVNTEGNSPPNVIRGPGSQDWDLGAEKNFKLWRETNLQFRGEFFNAFNHLNLEAPASNYFFNSPSGAQITRAGDKRHIQLALRLSF